MTLLAIVPAVFVYSRRPVKFMDLPGGVSLSAGTKAFQKGFDSCFAKGTGLGFLIEWSSGALHLLYGSFLARAVLDTSTGSRSHLLQPLLVSFKKR